MLGIFERQKESNRMDDEINDESAGKKVDHLTSAFQFLFQVGSSPFLVQLARL